jgi:MFS superfamily sulfate permease-like transporter
MDALASGVQTLKGYESSWLRHDIVAGLVMTTMLVPVGIAYAEASGVPGINGLYATIVPLLVYAIFGPSRILVLGPDSALAAVILARRAAVVLRAIRSAPLLRPPRWPSCLVSRASRAGLARLGFITELLSKPIRYGYMNGIALTVILSQIPKLLGFSVSGAGSVARCARHRREHLCRRDAPRALRRRCSHARVDPALKRWRACRAC